MIYYVFKVDVQSNPNLLSWSVTISIISLDIPDLFYNVSQILHGFVSFYSYNILCNNLKNLSSCTCTSQVLAELAKLHQHGHFSWASRLWNYCLKYKIIGFYYTWRPNLIQCLPNPSNVIMFLYVSNGIVLIYTTLFSHALSKSYLQTSVADATQLAPMVKPALHLLSAALLHFFELCTSSNRIFLAPQVIYW